MFIHHHAGRRSLAVSLLVASLVLSLPLLGGCGKDAMPIQVGFVAGLTGRTADLGTGGRNGVQLAIEQLNAAGGIDGRKVDLIIKDSESDTERARQMVTDLVAARVQAVLGPMTSAEAAATAPIATAGSTLMMSGSVTTTALSGLDDQFFRVIASTTQHSATMARYLYEQRKVKRTTLLVNLANKAYAQSWADDFSAAMKALGAPEPVRVDYAGAENTRFDELALALVKNKPDAIILVTNAVDAAHTANQLVKLGSKAVHVTSEWAGTGKLTELGGSNVDGFVVPQYLDLTSTAPAYLAFRDAYQKRFSQTPGFPAVVSYNAAQVLLHALREQRTEETLKQTLLRIRSFDGLQGSIVFDNFGDVQSPTYLTVVRDGRYVAVN